MVYDKIKQDFWFIFFTVSASNLGSRLFLNPDININTLIGDTAGILITTLIAMGLILYLFKGFSRNGWGFDF